MQLLLTFDVEVWCGSWVDLDDRFPSAFARYVYGHTKLGDFALPKTLEILDRHSVKAIFFVEPLFAARFGVRHLETIVSMIRSAGQDVQLHLHPEWTDEISPPPIVNASEKRQHLSYYSLEEQTSLVRLGLDLIEAAGAPRPISFRAGSFAANADTFSALRANGIFLDFSIDPSTPLSVADLRDGRDLSAAQVIDGVFSLPLTVFRDGFGRIRHAQVGACSSGELVEAIESAAGLGRTHFVLLSHNFEMLKPGTSVADKIVVSRFENLCRHLGAGGYGATAMELLSPTEWAVRSCVLPKTTRSATLRRYAEQALRRLM
jgi:hypothetical protein